MCASASLEATLPSRIEDVTLLGGGAQLERIEELLSERTGLSVTRLGLPKPELGTGLVAGGPPALFGPAIALALRGTARARTQMNFRQDESRAASTYRATAATSDPTGVMWGRRRARLASTLSGALLESGGARRSQNQVAELFTQAFPDKPVPENPVAAMRDAVREARERAEFLGVYRGNRSALDLLGEISRRVPADLDVIFEEVSIDRQTIRIRAFTKSFEAAERLGAELSKFEPSERPVVAIETDRRIDSRIQLTIGWRKDAEEDWIARCAPPSRLVPRERLCWDRRRLLALACSTVGGDPLLCALSRAGDSRERRGSAREENAPRVRLSPDPPPRWRRRSPSPAATSAPAREPRQPGLGQGGVDGAAASPPGDRYRLKQVE